MLNKNDPILVAEINAALRKNVQLYGHPYCPCLNPELYRSPESTDYICPCKDFRENTLPGETCHCGKFVKDAPVAAAEN